MTLICSGKRGFALRPLRPASQTPAVFCDMAVLCVCARINDLGDDRVFAVFQSMCFQLFNSAELSICLVSSRPTEASPDV